MALDNAVEQGNNSPTGKDSQEGRSSNYNGIIFGALLLTLAVGLMGPAITAGEGEITSGDPKPTDTIPVGPTPTLLIKVFGPILAKNHLGSEVDPTETPIATPTATPTQIIIRPPTPTLTSKGARNWQSGAAKYAASH